MVGLYKDPKGETVFMKTSTQAPTLGVSTDALKRRIKELEDEVKQKEVSYQPSTVASYRAGVPLDSEGNTMLTCLSLEHWSKNRTSPPLTNFAGYGPALQPHESIGTSSFVAVGFSF